MNRERILFFAVVALLGLWFFLRSPEKPGQAPPPRPLAIQRKPILASAYSPAVISELRVFTEPTNVRPHPRPVEALEKPRVFDLPNLWPPTSRSVSIDRYDQLRRDAAAPQAGPAQVVLPKAAADAGGASAGIAEDRIDAWKSKGMEQKGRVTTIVVEGGAQLREPQRPWPYGALVLKPPAGADSWKFLRALALLPDPDRAVEEGVKEVWAARPRAGEFRQPYPEDINGFEIAVDGKQQGYLHGLQQYLDVTRQAGKESHELRARAGRALLEEGLKAQKIHQEDLLQWSLALLGEAFERAQVENDRRTILLDMLRVAGALNDYERVLALAITHLKTYADSPEVQEYVGNVLASRTFSLAPFAIEWFALAKNSTSAQRRQIEELVREGRFDEANALVAAGRAGAAGPEQDLLKARVALARGDLDNATTFADRHKGAGGATGAEALQILGAVAYAKGDAAAAAGFFEEAAKAEPTRSTAFSDWGLALAVQGRSEDALVCFAEALRLDPVDNPVIPALGGGYLKLAAGEAKLRAALDALDAGRKDPRIAADKTAEAEGLRTAAGEDFAAAAEMLGKLEDANRSDLLVRYMLGYAKERTGNLKEAAELYRATIDGDPRYRVAIARLGVVQSQLALASRDAKDAAAAIAHLSKAVQLSPQEAILPYVLGRFLLTFGEELKLADQMLQKAGSLPVSERNGNLPLWADLGRACLAYADEQQDVVAPRKLLNTLLERIKDKEPSGTPEQKLMEHEVYRAAKVNLQIVEENEKKVDRTWNFTAASAKLPDWKYDVKAPAECSIEPGKGLVFSGEISYGGGQRTAASVLQNCATKYQGQELRGETFWALEVMGVIPDAGESAAEFGVGVIQPPKSDQVLGVSVRRKRTGNLEVRIDGADRGPLKNLRDWYEMKKVPWPTGEFRLKIEVVPEYGLGRRRQQGRFRLLLNGEEVFRKEFGDAEGERASTFTPGKASQVIELDLWVEGVEGVAIKDIQVKTVTLTVESGK